MLRELHARRGAGTGGHHGDCSGRRYIDSSARLPSFLGLSPMPDHQGDQTASGLEQTLARGQRIGQNPIYRIATLGVIIWSEGRDKVKKTGLDPQEGGHARSVWLKRTAIVWALGMILTGCAPSEPQSGKRPISPVQPTLVSVTPTHIPSPSREIPRPIGTKEAQIPGPAVSPTPFTEPKELPTKGSPGAKVTLVEFCDFY